MAGTQNTSAGVTDSSAPGGDGQGGKGSTVSSRIGTVATTPGDEPATVSKSATTAMVPMEVSVESSHEIGDGADSFSPLVARLPVELDVMVPVRNFRVRDLLNLGLGQVIASQWGHGEDVPVAAGEVALAWSEFEVVESRLAVRITRLS